MDSVDSQTHFSRRLLVLLSTVTVLMLSAVILAPAPVKTGFGLPAVFILDTIGLHGSATPLRETQYIFLSWLITALIVTWPLLFPRSLRLALIATLFIFLIFFSCHLPLIECSYGRAPWIFLPFYWITIMAIYYARKYTTARRLGYFGLYGIIAFLILHTSNRLFQLVLIPGANPNLLAILGIESADLIVLGSLAIISIILLFITLAGLAWTFASPRIRGHESRTR